MRMVICWKIGIAMSFWMRVFVARRRHTREVDRARTGRHGIDALAQLGHLGERLLGGERVLEEEDVAAQLRRSVIRGRGIDRLGELVARPDHDEQRRPEPLLEHRLHLGLELRPLLAVGAEQHVAALQVGADILVPGVAEARDEIGHADRVAAADVDAPQQRDVRGAAARGIR